MALKSSLLWFRRNWRKTSSRFFTSRGPCTIRADFCGDKGQSLSRESRVGGSDLALGTQGSSPHPTPRNSVWTRPDGNLSSRHKPHWLAVLGKLFI